MFFNQTVESFGMEDQSWLGSSHGTDTAQPCTLDTSTFVAATHYPNGFFVSGIVLGKITATGKYGPYVSTASDGRQTAVGVLFTSVKAPTTGNDWDPAAAILLHGFLKVAKLPILTGNAGFLDSTAQTALAGRFVFV